MSHGILVLTSSGFSNKEALHSFEDLITDTLVGGAVAIIVTASREKEHNKYNQLAKKQFEDMGFGRCDFIDFETNPEADLGMYKVFYVCGGNTFKLLKFAREVNFGKSVKSLLERGGIYVGVSAGSILVGPSIAVAGEILSDENEVDLNDLAGLCITNRIILPHYEEVLEEDVRRFEESHSVVIDRVKDGEAVIVKGEHII